MASRWISEEEWRHVGEWRAALKEGKEEFLSSAKSDFRENHLYMFAYAAVLIRTRE